MFHSAALYTHCNPNLELKYYNKQAWSEPLDIES